MNSKKKENAIGKQDKKDTKKVSKRHKENEDNLQNEKKKRRREEENKEREILCQEEKIEKIIEVIDLSSDDEKVADIVEDLEKESLRENEENQEKQRTDSMQSNSRKKSVENENENEKIDDKDNENDNEKINFAEIRKRDENQGPKEKKNSMIEETECDNETKKDDQQIINNDSAISIEKLFIFPLSTNEKCPSFLAQFQFNLLIGVCVTKIR